MKNGLIVAAILVVILVAVGYFLTSKATVVPPATNTPQATNSTGVQDDDLQLITVNATDFSFDKKEIQLEANKKVRLTLKNTGRMVHDFVVEGQGIATKIISTGSEDTIEFSLPKGEYPVSCSVGDHKSRGMVGKIVVK